MKPFLDFLENKYYDLYGYAAMSKDQKASDLTKYVKMGSLNNNYTTATSNVVVNNAYSAAEDWTFADISGVTGYPINGTYNSSNKRKRRLYGPYRLFYLEYPSFRHKNSRINIRKDEDIYLCL